MSFTNLTATALGDVIPVTPPARVIVMLEQFSGIGYVAVVVSRLIGMTLTQQKEKDTPDSSRPDRTHTQKGKS